MMAINVRIVNESDGPEEAVVGLRMTSKPRLDKSKPSKDTKDIYSYVPRKSKMQAAREAR
jgi:hypothetical protein